MGLSVWEVSARCWQMNSSTGKPCSSPGDAQDTEDDYHHGDDHQDDNDEGGDDDYRDDDNDEET